MKILIHDYAGHPFQVQLSRELSSLGYEVLHAFAGGLLTPRGQLTKRSGDAAGFSIREISMNKGYRKFKYSFIKRRFFELEYGRTLAALIIEERPDIVLSGNTPTEAQAIAQKAAIQSGIRFYSWVQDFYGIAVDSLVRKKIPLLGGLIGSYFKRLDNKVLKRSNGVVVITEDFSPLVEKAGVASSRILVAPNWAPLNELPVIDKGNDWSIRHDLQNTFNFLYSGTLAMKHNPFLLLDVAKRFRNNVKVRVVVTSEGPGADWLKERKSEEGLDNLILLPFQPFEEMPQMLASADVLMAVLERDAGVFSVPSKVLTYMCASRSLLLAVPKENLAAKIVTDVKAGLVSDPEDETRFVTNAVELYENEASRTCFAGSARAYAEKNFDIELIADRFETFLELKPSE